MNRKTLFVTAAAAVALIISLGLLAENGNGGKIVLYGNIDIRQADIGFMVGGTLKEMFFEEGERVKKGDLLAVLDDRDYRHNYQRALAEIDCAEAQLAEARGTCHQPAAVQTENCLRKKLHFLHKRQKRSGSGFAIRQDCRRL